VRPTGNAIIDRMIGGFPTGLPLVVTGLSGTGRTVLSLELAHRALGRGESVRFLTTEAAPSLLRQAASLDFDFEAALDTDELGVLELHASAPTLIRENGMEPLIEALRPELEGATLVIVDPLSALLAQIVDEARLREIVRGLARALGDFDLLLTVEAERQSVQRPLELVLSELCGAYFRLERDTAGRRTLTVEKTRTGLGASDRVEFTIGPGGTHLVGDAEPSPGARRAIDVAVQQAAAAQPAIETGERATILVVDDDRLHREMLGDWLSGKYDVVKVSDGFEALAALVANKPNLVILDLIMPRVTGYELLYSMRRSGFEMPVLVASSRLATMGDRLGPLVLGATDFLSKPLSRVEVLHKVETLLRLPQTRDARFGEAEAQALFGSFSGSRLLELPDFAERVGRACDFGEKYEMTSSLVGLRAARSEDLDRWMEVANRQLRFEDAVVRAEKRVALLLFVATAPQYAQRVIKRLAGLAEDGALLPAVETEVWQAERLHASPDALAELAQTLDGPGATP
jgi:CheY-like chemotaxis protein/KaiC/GvpD/RAD55 family RecA-like ATPase